MVDLLSSSLLSVVGVELYDFSTTLGGRLMVIVFVSYSLRSSSWKIRSDPTPLREPYNIETVKYPSVIHASIKLIRLLHRVSSTRRNSRAVDGLSLEGLTRVGSIGRSSRKTWLWRLATIARSVAVLGGRTASTLLGGRSLLDGLRKFGWLARDFLSLFRLL